MYHENERKEVNARKEPGEKAHILFLYLSARMILIPSHVFEKFPYL